MPAGPPCRSADVHRSRQLLSHDAQFLAVCRSVKTTGTCENLPVPEPVSPHQEILYHASALPSASTLQRRTVPSVHPYSPVERSAAAMSALPEPPHWRLGYVPVSTWLQTLLVSRLQAHLHRPYR